MLTGTVTCTGLMRVVDDCPMDIDNKKLVGSVLLDFSAFFDVSDHGLLLEKLAAYGFSSSALTWI